MSINHSQTASQRTQRAAKTRQGQHYNSHGSSAWFGGLRWNSEEDNLRWAALIESALAQHQVRLSTASLARLAEHAARVQASPCVHLKKPTDGVRMTLHIAGIPVGLPERGHGSPLIRLALATLQEYEDGHVVSGWEYLGLTPAMRTLRQAQMDYEGSPSRGGSNLFDIDGLFLPGPETPEEMVHSMLRSMLEAVDCVRGAHNLERITAALEPLLLDMLQQRRRRLERALRAFSTQLNPHALQASGGDIKIYNWSVRGSSKFRTQALRCIGFLADTVKRTGSADEHGGSLNARHYEQRRARLLELEATIDQGRSMTEYLMQSLRVERWAARALIACPRPEYGAAIFDYDFMAQLAPLLQKLGPDYCPAGGEQMQLVQGMVIPGRQAHPHLAEVLRDALRRHGGWGGVLAIVNRYRQQNIHAPELHDYLAHLLDACDNRTGVYSQLLLRAGLKNLYQACQDWHARRYATRAPNGASGGRSWPSLLQKEIQVGAYSLRPLSCEQDLCDEADEMDHCVDGYGADSERYGLFAVHGNGERATLHMAWTGSEFRVRQLRGRSNESVSPAMMNMAERLCRTLRDDLMLGTGGRYGLTSKRLSDIIDASIPPNGGWGPSLLRRRLRCQEALTALAQGDDTEQAWPRVLINAADPGHAGIGAAGDPAL